MEIDRKAESASASRFARPRATAPDTAGKESGMLQLEVGDIVLKVDATNTDEFAAEATNHIKRVLGSRGQVINEINRKYGPVTIYPQKVSDSRVAIRLETKEGWKPLDAELLRRGDSNEVALSYLIGRLLCRRLIGLEDVRNAPPLPTGRRLIDLPAVQYSAIPKSVYIALGQLHVIGFTGVPSGEPTCRLRIADSIDLPIFEVDAPTLHGEMEELLGRMREKIDLARGGVDRYGPLSLQTELRDDAVYCSAANWSPAHADLALFEWVMIHLLRPRKPNPFLPMRPMLLRPRDLFRAKPLPNGTFLPDLPVIRNQLMPAKVAQLLEDIHKHGGKFREDGGPAEIACRFGRLTLMARGDSTEALAERARGMIAPVAELFRTEGGGAEKYGPVTLEVEATATHVEFKSRQFRPGCPDEILCEFLVASLLQDDTIPLEIARDAPQLDGRSLLGSPAIQRQLMPSGTVELLANVHSGTGSDRRESGWKRQIR